MIKETNNKPPDQKIIDEITRALLKMQYGELVITVHNAKVVQIEKREKKRFV
ncbi:MAG: YezD family protein [Candidatus Omnitrophica bacterium]|nr:YezD family protein [Candidatus Omnitrophota bacterium]